MIHLKVQSQRQRQLPLYLNQQKRSQFWLKLWLWPQLNLLSKLKLWLLLVLPELLQVLLLLLQWLLQLILKLVNFSIVSPTFNKTLYWRFRFLLKVTSTVIGINQNFVVTQDPRTVTKSQTQSLTFTFTAAGQPITFTAVHNGVTAVIIETTGTDGSATPIS